MKKIDAQEIIQKSLEYGADLAGIARVEDLRQSPTYPAYMQNPNYEDYEGIPDWPEDMPGILVFALRHDRQKPALDWWDEKPGGTPGNRMLIGIQKRMKAWLDEVDIPARSLPYKIEKGGVFLKDAAALAGVGVIGVNNLLLTEPYGASVRLRGMYLGLDLAATGPSEFDPCAACDQRCFKACPQNAFEYGSYERARCRIQMALDESQPRPLAEEPETMAIHYCRACELACPYAG